MSMFKSSKKSQSQNALNSLNSAMNHMGSGIGDYVNYHTNSGGYSYLGTNLGTWGPNGLSNGLFIPGAIPGASYYSYSRNYFHTPKFVVDVNIVNLEEFKKYKNEGVVYYDNMLLPFNEFYRLVEERYNKRVQTDLNEAVENYNQYVQACEDKFNQEMDIYNKLIKQEIENNTVKGNFQPYWANIFNSNKLSLKKPSMLDIGMFVKPTPPQLEINLTVPCDCEVCLNKLKEDQDQDCISDQDCGIGQVCINGQCVPMVSYETITIDYSLPGSGYTNGVNSDDYFPKKFKPEELEQLVNDIKRNRGSRSCNTTYPLNPLTFKIDEDVAQEYFEKIASVHDSNKNLYNPGSLNMMEINAYIERLKLNFIDKMIIENERK